MNDSWMFAVTLADLDALDSEAFDAVWMALGILIRARRKVEPAVALPEPVVLVEAVTPAASSLLPFTCLDCGAIARNGTGLSAHRRARHSQPKAGGSARIAKAKAAEVEAVRATAAAIREREPEAPVNGADFAARAAARHAETWAEQHPETA